MSNIFRLNLGCLCLALILAVAGQGHSQDLVAAKKKSPKKASAKPEAPKKSPQISPKSETYSIDLPTVLRLAGAQNLDVKIAGEKLAEAKANHEAAREQFFPWVSPGVAYRRHDGQIQDVFGGMATASKQTYSVGSGVTAQVDLGEAYYKTLAAHQLVQAASQGLETEKQVSVLQAASGYFELAKAQGQIGIAQEAVRISAEYARQLDEAVKIGLAFKGDALRVQTQTERYRLTLRKAQEQAGVVSAQLAQTLHLDSTVRLKAQENDLAPLVLIETNSALHSLVTQALNSRPELKQSQSLVAAARDEKNGAVYGPLVPTVGAQMFLGGLGGGFNDSTGNFRDTQDYQFFLGWRIGPGGVFDRARIRATEARVSAGKLGVEKMKDEIVREVVENLTRVQSQADQINTIQHALSAAEETYRLTKDRKQFGVGVVLEYIQAEQELTALRNDYLAAVAEHNKAQYALSKAIGTATGQAAKSK